MVSIVPRQAAAPAPSDESLAAATRREFEAAGRLGTSDAVAALILARQMDDGGHSGASWAALSKEFHRMKAVVLDGGVSSGEVLGDDVEWGVG